MLKSLLNHIFVNLWQHNKLYSETWKGCITRQIKWYMKYRVVWEDWNERKVNFALREENQEAFYQ